MFITSFYKRSNLPSKGASFKTVAILCCSLMLFTADIIGQNLISNPGAESDPTSSGWTIVSEGTNCFGSDNWRIIGNQNGFPVAQSGNYLFFPGCGGIGAGQPYEIYQDVDVSSFAATIEAGTQTFSFSGYTQVFEQETNDGARIIVEYRNLGGTVLDAYDTGENNLGNVWTYYADSKLAPAGTRTVRIRLIAYSRAGTSIDGYFDNLSLCPDNDGDGVCDDVDGDDDNDGVMDVNDNCPLTANADQADFDFDGTGDACDPNVGINGVINYLIGYVEGLGIRSSVERSITRRLELALNRFCPSGNTNATAPSLNSIINYLQAQSGNGIPSDAADHVIAQLNNLIDALNQGIVVCSMARPAPPTAPGVITAAPQNYQLTVSPNPFREQQSIRFYLPEAGPAALDIFNLNGQRLATLHSGYLDAGQQDYSWDGTDERGQQLSSGIYLIRLRTEEGTLTQKVSLVR